LETVEDEVDLEAGVVVRIEVSVVVKGFGMVCNGEYTVCDGRWQM
jgi:hypothetical protein